MEIEDIGVIKHLVALGLGAAIVPEEAITGDVPVAGLLHRPLDPPLVVTLALIRRRHQPDDPALRIVSEAILKSVRGDPRTEA